MSVVLDNSFRYVQMMHNSFTYIACNRQVPSRRVNGSAPEIVAIFSGHILSTANSADPPPAGAAYLPRTPILAPCGRTEPVSTVSTKERASHAEWPKENEQPPIQTCGDTCRPPEAVGTECHPA
jgi:hypothetical protein